MLKGGMVTDCFVDDFIEILNLPHMCSRTMALGFTQPLTELFTRNLPLVGGVKSGWCVTVTTNFSFVTRLFTKCGKLNRPSLKDTTFSDHSRKVRGNVASVAEGSFLYAFRA
jgi:hypothetical protein